MGITLRELYENDVNNIIQDPWDDVIDEYDISQEDSEKMIAEFKQKISDCYEKVLKSRNEFECRKYMQQEPAEEELER